ncbi:MAG: hypothetical protein WDA07_01505 [Leucobacter sp.]
MLFKPSVDRYDELRREWIAEHASIFTMQIRRAEMLNRRIRRRHREIAGARPNPYDDHATHPLFSRGAKTVEAKLELLIVLVAAFAAPLGWPVGRFIYQRIETLIPDRLRSYPIPALLFTAVVLGTVTVLLYSPGDDLSSALLAPWLIGQLPAAALTAAVYGILNGWLAVDGSTEWWPLTPTAPSVELPPVLLPDDLTAPSLFDTVPVADPIDRTPPGAGAVRSLPRSSRLLTVGLILNTIGIIWTLASVGVGVKTVVVDSLTPSTTIGSLN